MGQHRAELPSQGARPLESIQKLLLASTAVGTYAVSRYVLGLLGLPAVPNVSALLLQDQPLYGPLVVLMLTVVLTLLARPLVGQVRYDAPLFCAVVGLLALPVHGGDVRNALLNSGSPSVYLRMAVELLILGVAVFLGYFALYRGADVTTPADMDTIPPAPVDEDSATDRVAAVAVQTVVTLAILSILGQSPLKGQAMFGVALAGGLGAWLTYKTRIVRGSVWYVAGTLLAGLIAYAWTFFQPEGLPLGDTRGYLAGAARSLPIHYATAGVAGTIYGYWAGRSAATPDVT
ncbi:MAG TPA: hypothetical protein VF595_11130 [Tepidisphaeraceae bacterium]